MSLAKNKILMPLLLVFTLYGCIGTGEIAAAASDTPQNTTSLEGYETEQVTVSDTPPSPSTPTPGATVQPDAAATELPEPKEWQLIEMPKLPAGQAVNLDEIHMVDERNGWAVVYREDDEVIYDSIIGGLIPIEIRVQDHILITRDGGNTWQDVSPPELVVVSEYQGNDYYGSIKKRQYSF